MNKCEYEKDGHCTLNECMYGDFLFIDDSQFESGRYCFCDIVEKARRNRVKAELIAEREATLNELVSRLEKIDDCEFAMYTLGLIKEIVEDMKICKWGYNPYQE